MSKDIVVHGKSFTIGAVVVIVVYGFAVVLSKTFGCDLCLQVLEPLQASLPQGTTVGVSGTAVVSGTVQP